MTTSIIAKGLPRGSNEGISDDWWRTRNRKTWFGTQFQEWDEEVEIIWEDSFRTTLNMGWKHYCFETSINCICENGQKDPNSYREDDRDRECSAKIDNRNEHSENITSTHHNRLRDIDFTELMICSFSWSLILPMQMLLNIVKMERKQAMYKLPST